MELRTRSIMEVFPSRSMRYDKFTNTKKGGIRPSCDVRGLLVVYISESGHGVSSKSMFTLEIPRKLPFQECGTKFLANLGVQMAWVPFFLV